MCLVAVKNVHLFEQQWLKKSWRASFCFATRWRQNQMIVMVSRSTQTAGARLGRFVNNLRKQKTKQNKNQINKKNTVSVAISITTTHLLYLNF